MAELATIARPYAEALFKAVSPDLSGAAAWLEPVARVAADPELRQFADGPKTTPQQVLSVVTGVSGVDLPAAGSNFLTTLLENGRFAALPEIARQFRALLNAQSGASDAVVYSAFPIDAQALAGVSSVLERRFKRKLQLSVKQDASLIGGIRVVVGDEVLDTSVKARLEQMKVALAA